MKATKEDAVRLVSDHFQLVVEGKHVKPLIGEFEGYELIAKGKAIIEVANTPSLNKNQKQELFKIIKEL